MYGVRITCAFCSFILNLCILSPYIRATVPMSYVWGVNKGCQNNLM